MSNANAPFGLKPLNLNGTTWSGQGKLVYIPSSQGAIYIGDPLIPLGTMDTYGVPAWGIATAGTGHIITGSGVTLLQSNTIYHPTSVVDYGFVCDDPDVMYSIQDDGSASITAGGYSNANLQVGSGGSTQTGLSSWQLVATTAASGNATYQVKMLGLTRGPDNALGLYARWNVMLNLSALQQGTAGL